MKHLHAVFWLLLGCLGALLVTSSCTPNLAGATTETTNGITGLVLNKDNTPAAGVVVQLFSSDYDPVADTASGKKVIDTTDRLGTYSFGRLATGTYVVLARSRAAGTGFIARDIPVKDSVVTPVSGGMLDRTGSIAAELTPGAVPTGGYAYIPGTDISCTIGSSGAIGLDGIPPGTIPEVVLVSGAGERRNVLRESISVAAGEQKTIEKPLWKYTRRLQFNTTTDGAGVNGTVTGFPVLIRLNSENFDFSQARSDGADVEFVAMSGVTLPCEIERWSPAAGRAEVWVRVDTIRGNDSAQSIRMYWGNPDAVSQTASGGAVFDTADGYQGVWHLADAAGAATHDATVNQYDGTSPDTARPDVAEGAIGDCRRFDGSADFITMPNTAAGKLNFPQAGSYTVSAWVQLDTFDNASHCIVSKGYEQYYLRSTYISMNVLNTSPLWEFVEFSETAKWQTSNTPVAGKQWALVTGVRSGSRQLLYCNGVLVDSTISLWTNTVSRNTSNDLTIGRFAKPVTVPITEGYCHFRGGIDEVRIISRSQSADWIRICYMNQRSDDRLVMFR
jgi:hypothetical protein